jgi:hypothetical protein
MDPSATGSAWRRFVEAVVEGGVRQRLKRLMHGRRTNAVQPAAPIAVARRGERGAGQLLGIQAMRHSLRRILPFGQFIAKAGCRNRFAGELVAEAGLVTLKVMRARRFGCAQPLRSQALPC